MKNIPVIFTFIILSLSLNSCRSDGSIGDTGGQFGFSILRDQDFPEQSVNDTLAFKYNVKANYSFQTVPMTIQYTTDSQGVLLLGNQPMEQNRLYVLNNAENTLRYVGKDKGTHNLKIIAKNDKGVGQEEEFSFPYSVSDFNVKLDQPSSDYYQGQTINLTGKILPANSASKDRYEIKFQGFEGDISIGNTEVQPDTYYPITNPDNFTILVFTKTAGSQKLSYTIKNSTVNKDEEINLNFRNRLVSIQGMSVQPVKTPVNGQLSLVGTVIKGPIKDNQNIQYKTWLTNATNNNLSGVENTNSIYNDYTLPSNGAILINMLAKSAGSYTLNFQAKDEFGNKSDIQRFDLTVQAPITINNASANASVVAQYQTSTMKWLLFGMQIKPNVQITSQDSRRIAKITYKSNITFMLDGKVLSPFSSNFTYQPGTPSTTVWDQAEKVEGWQKMYDGAQFTIDQAILTATTHLEDGTTYTFDVPVKVRINPTIQ